MSEVENGFKRIENCFKLMNINDEKSLKELFNIITFEKCELVKHEAIFCLGEMGNKLAIPFLKNILQTSNSQVVIHECLISLGNFSTKNEIEFIEKYTKNKDLVISNSAKISIQRINQNDFFLQENKSKKEYEIYLVEKLNKFDSLIENDTIQLMFQLMNIFEDSHLELFKKIYYNSTCPVIRHEVAFILGEVNSKKAIDFLEEILKVEKNPVVVHETLFAIGTSKNKSSIKILEKFLENEEYIIRESARISIDRILKLKTPYNGVDFYKTKENK